MVLTFVVFYLTNLHPNLEKLAKGQGNFGPRCDYFKAGRCDVQPVRMAPVAGSLRLKRENCGRLFFR